MSEHTSRTTTDHEEIRRWAEARDATPSRVKGTGGDGDPGMIRLDFPGFSGEGSLEEISWDDWFRAFDDNGLALVFQEETASGERSNFNKLISRASVAEHDEGGSRSSRGSRSRIPSTTHHREPQHADRGGDASLKEREYRDPSGEVHHHTRKYMDEHRGEESDSES